MLQAVKDFIRRFFRPTVDDCIGTVHRMVDKLEDVAERHAGLADDKRCEAIQLHAEADAHSEEHVRALRTQSKLLDLVS